MKFIVKVLTKLLIFLEMRKFLENSWIILCFPKIFYLFFEILYKFEIFSLYFILFFIFSISENKILDLYLNIFISLFQFRILLNVFGKNEKFIQIYLILLYQFFNI